MKLSKEDFLLLADVAIQAALAAGNLIRSVDGGSVLVDEKTENKSRAFQVVTEVDFKSQDIILKYIQPTLKEYDLALLTEESPDDGSRFKKDYFWCIDPLDGTLPFTECRPGYAVSIALVSRSGESQIGVVYDPLNENLYHAVKGCGAFKNRKPWKLDLSLNENPVNTDRGGAVMNACRVLEEAPAYYSKRPKKAQGNGCLWDYAATTCLFNEVGAWVSDAYGNPLRLNNSETLFMNKCGVLFASSKKIATSLFL